MRASSTRKRGVVAALVIPPRQNKNKANARLRLTVLADDAELDALDLERPRTRGECANGVRPCPWVSCRHNLYLEVTPSGSLKIPYPDLDPHELEHSCSLDLAEKPLELHRIGEVLNVSKERIRQVEELAIASMREASEGHIDREDLAHFETPERVEPDHYITGLSKDEWRKSCRYMRDHDHAID